MGGQAGASEPEGRMRTGSEPPGLSGIDSVGAHPARIWDYYLGGKHNYEADRAVARKVIERTPATPALARGVRRYQGHAARLLAARGVRQFLDVGAGIPGPGSLHEVAQAVAPESRVVYADSDPLAVAYGRALLNGRGAYHYLQADLRTPDEILAGAGEVLGFGEPTAICLLGVLDFVGDAEDPWRLVSELARAFTGELYLVVAHGTADFSPRPLVAPQRRYHDDERTAATVTPRERRAIERFFDGMTMLEGGLLPVSDWLARLDPAAKTVPGLAGYAGTGRRTVR